MTADSSCAVCGLFALDGVALFYLCRHLVHATCALPNPDVDMPERPESIAMSQLMHSDRRINSRQRSLGSKLSYAAAVRVRVGGCPVCRSL
jgi:hypothetical protein